MLTTLTDGQVFGELSLLRKDAAHASVVVNDLLEAFELYSEGFDTICEHEPDFRKKIEAGVQARERTGSQGAHRLMWKAMGASSHNVWASSCASASEASTSAAGGGHKRWAELRNVNKAVSTLRSATTKKMFGGRALPEPSARGVEATPVGAPSSPQRGSSTSSSAKASPPAARPAGQAFSGAF